jgi:ribonuclease BN (tRNA processing enzyme)
MRLTVVGCSGSYPGPQSAASSYLVQADDADGRTWNLVLDLGSGSLGPLQRYIELEDIDAIGISHLHPDHMADISGLFVYLKYAPRALASRQVDVHGPFGTLSRIAEAHGTNPGETLSDHIVVHAWQPGRAVKVGPMSVLPVAVEHPLPAYGVRVTGPSEEDPERTVTLAYTGDTDVCPGLDELARGADVLLAEAAFVEGRDDHLPGIHLTGRRAGEAAVRAGAGTLVITHVPPWNDPEVAMVEAREVYDGPLVRARPGLVVEL